MRGGSCVRRGKRIAKLWKSAVLRRRSKSRSTTDAALAIRYPPFTKEKVAKLRALALGRPDFDREGKVVVSWWWRALTGGGLGMAGLLREYRLIV